MRAWQLGLFSSWQNPSSCSPQFSTAQRGVNQESFARPYQTDLFNSFPVQSGSLWGNTKQPWKTTSFFRKTAMVEQKRAQNAGIYKRACTAAFRKDLRARAGSLPNPPKLRPFSPPCRTSTDRPSTRDKTWLGSSRPPSAVPAGNAGPAFPAARRAGAASEAARRHCAAQTESRRESPLQGCLREGIVLFMRREEKIKLPCWFFFVRDEGQEVGSLIFGG